MDARDRKRERHRRERAERRRELAARRQQQAGAPRVESRTVARDLRGLGPTEWAFLQEVEENRVLWRAREIWPRDELLRKFTQGRALSAFRRPQVARDLSALLTLASRTLACDPPWVVPYVSVETNGLQLTTEVTIITPDLERDPERGRLGHWKLVLPLPDGRPVAVWFTSHAVERMAGRLAMDEFVFRRYFADVWAMLISDADGLDALRMRKWIAPREGALALFLEMETPRGRWELGYCPLEIVGERAVAKTFLEPWMPPGGPGALPEAERARRHEAYRSEVVPHAHDVFKAVALRGLAHERTQPVVDLLARAVPVQSSGGMRWVALVRAALEAADAERPEARSLLERALDEREQAWNAWTDELRRAWGSIRSLAHETARARLALARLLDRAAASAGPEAAGPLRERAARERAAALAEEPGLGEE